VVFSFWFFFPLIFCIYNFLPPYVPHAPYNSYSLTWLPAEYKKHLIITFDPTFFSVLLRRPKYLPQHPIQFMTTFIVKRYDPACRDYSGQEFRSTEKITGSSKIRYSGFSEMCVFRFSVITHFRRSVILK
jgi:hypothetical protein